MTTFATNLLRLRRKEGLTQEQLATKAGMPAAQISHYECGRREPSLTNLRALQEVLQCGYPAFFTNKNNDNTKIQNID